MATKTKAFKETKEQAAIREAIASGKQSVIVKARAGTGKSTTIENVSGKNSVILCFNRKPADEMKERLAGQPKIASTFHSYGNQFVPGRFDKFKLKYAIQDIVFKGNKPAKDVEYEQQATLIKLVDWCRDQAIRPDDPIEKIAAAVTDVRLDVDEPLSQVDHVVELLQRMAEDKKRKDISDMQWQCFVHGYGRNAAYELHVDEAQDMNPIRQQLAALWASDPKRLHAVGDDFQAIYAWNGAMPDSLDLFRQAHNSKELPLTTCWRCPSSHLDTARSIVPDIQDKPGAIKGTINYYDTRDDFQINTDGQLIMCRTNAPLIRMYYRIRKESTQTVVLTADITEILKGLLGWKKYDEVNTEWIDKFMTRMQKRIDFAPTTSRKGVLMDHRDALRELIDNNPNQTVGGLHKIIDQEFTPPEHLPNNTITLSSIHAAKGLEHEHTVIYGTSSIPHPMATLPYEITQEMNLLYVARTRSKNIMDWVTDCTV